MDAHDCLTRCRTTCMACSFSWLTAKLETLAQRLVLLSFVRGHQRSWDKHTSPVEACRWLVPRMRP